MNPSQIAILGYRQTMTNPYVPCSRHGIWIMEILRMAIVNFY